MMKEYAAFTAAIAIGLGSLTVVAADTASTPLRCHGHKPTIVGTKVKDVLRGTPHRDVIAGLGGSDKIIGRGGDDILCGGPARDRLLGGRGSDRLDGGGSGDNLRGGPGPDRSIDHKNGMSWNPRTQDYDGYPNVFVDGPGRDVMRGRPNAKTDELTFAYSQASLKLDWRHGTARTDTHNEFAHVEFVIGTKYADVMRGSDRADVMLGGPGADTITGRGGDDEIVGGANRGPTKDTLRGNDGDDLLYPSTGSRRAGRGSMSAFGGAGEDYLGVAPAGGRYDGGSGTDDLWFDTGAKLRVDLSQSAAIGNDFHARFTGAEHYTVKRTPKPSIVIGSDDADYVIADNARVRGNGGADKLWARTVSGGAGNDEIWHDGVSGAARGGSGDDMMRGSGRGFGGAGDDTMVWKAGDAYGGDGADTLRIDWFANTRLHGGPGPDALHLAPSLDPGLALDGGKGVDIANFGRYRDDSAAPLTISLAQGTASDSEHSVPLSAIENVRGSRLGDEVIGDDGDNTLTGGPGDDSADGRAGNDVCEAETVTNCEG